MAKRDVNGPIVTSPNLLKDLYLITNKYRLRERPMKPELLDIFCLKTELWDSRLKEIVYKKTEPEELEKVLKF